MRDFIKSLLLSFIAITSIIAMAICIPKCASAGEYLNVDDLYIRYLNYTNPGSDPLVTNNGLPNRGLDKHLDLTLNTTFFYYLYCNTRVHSDTDYNALTNERGQFRVVGLEYELGVRMNRVIDLFVYHHSQHLLDTPGITGFPQQDAVGIRFNLIKSKRFDSIFE